MAEGNVQLKLQTTLDLAFLRAQVASLGQSLKAGSVSVVATLDTEQLQKNIAKLGKEVKISVNDSQVEGARLRLAKLNQSLATFRRATATPLEIKVRYVQEGLAPAGLSSQKRGTFRQRLETVSPDEVKRLYRAAAQAGIVAFDEATARNKGKIVTSLNKAGEDAVGGLLNGITSEKAALKTAAQGLGDSLIRALKASLDIASPSKRARDEIGKPIGGGIEQGVESSLKQAQTLNIADLRRYFNALKAEARQGSVQVAALIAASMAGLVRLPGGKEQRTRLQQSAAAINAAMTGPVLGNVQARRRTAQGQSQAAAATTPIFLSALPLMMGMKPQEWQQRMSGLYGQRYNAPGLQGFTRPNEKRISSLINLLGSARGGLGAGGGGLVMQPVGIRRPSIAETGYRNAALSPSLVNYPVGMPPAYAAGFVGRPSGRFTMSNPPMVEPKIMGGFMAELQRTIAAVARFRDVLSKRLPALPAAGITGLGGARTGRTAQALPRTHWMPQSTLASRQFVRSRVQVGTNATTLGSPRPFLGAQVIQATPQGAQWMPQGTFLGQPFIPSSVTTPFVPSPALRWPAPFGSGGGGQGGGVGPGGGQGGGVGPGGGGGSGVGPGGGGGGAQLRGQASPLTADYFENATRYAEALKVAQVSARNFTAANLPLIGGLRGISMEFGEAVKQVLLYGTAYKGLAFVMSLPGQILNAAKSQQQFNNAMQVATQDTGTFGKELLYVDNVQRAFGLNLQTTRAGFTRLYASMAPTGFDSGSIEKLFTGISAATAALQLTPDNAERVIYAFGQMASKGQIMSEELKGQLGDVLPGALAIFAKAAGMSVKEFNKAMEDGEFTGQKFRDTFAKVADELINRFGTGAQAAGKSLQGLINTVQGDFQRTLEALSPLANAAAQAVLVPFGKALQQLSSSAKIATGEIERTYAQLQQAQKDLKDTKDAAGVGGTSPEEARQIKAAEQNVAALTVRYQALMEAAKDPAIQKQVGEIQRFVTELEKAGTFVMNLASTIGSMLSPVLSLLGTNLTTVISLITTFYIGFQTARLAAMALMGTLLLYRGLSVILGFTPAARGAVALAGAFNVLGVAATGTSVKVVGLRLALTALVASTVVGAVVAGIVAIASAFATMRDRASEAAQASKDAAQAAVTAATSGDVAGASMQVQNILAQSRANQKAWQTLQAIFARSSRDQRQGRAPMVLKPEEVVDLRGSPLGEDILKTGTMRGGFREIRVPSVQEMGELKRRFGSLAGVEKISFAEAKAAEQRAREVAARVGMNVPNLPPASAEADPQADEKAQKERDKAQRERDKQLRDQERLASQEQQRILAAQELRSELNRLNFEETKTLAEQTLEHSKNMIDAEFSYREARANELQALELRLGKQLSDARLNSEKAIQDAMLQLQEARLNAQAATDKAAAAKAADALIVDGSQMSSTGTTGNSATQRLMDAASKNLGLFAGSTERCADAIRVLFKEAGLAIGVTRKAWDNLDTSARMASSFFGSDIGQRITRQEDLRPGDLVGFERTYGRWGRGVQTHVGMYAGDGMMYDHSSRQGLVRRPMSTFAGKFMYGVRPTALQSMSGTAFSTERREDAAANELIIATRQEEISQGTALVDLYNKLSLASGNLRANFAEAIGTALPSSQMQLDNDLLEERNRLLLSGAPESEVETQMRRSKAIAQTNSIQKLLNQTIQKATSDLETYKKQLSEGKINQQVYDIAVANSNKQISDAQELIALTNTDLQAFNDQLERTKSINESMEPQLQIAAALREARDELEKLLSPSNQIITVANGIGTAFGDAFKGLISGASSAREIMANFFQSLSDMFADMVGKMIMEWMKTQVIKGLSGLLAGVGGFAGGISSAASTIGFGGSFDSGIGGLTGAQDFSSSFGSIPLFSGFPQFANGGIVQGPTLGLVGEGRYNEAIVPLPDGKSIPVELGGGMGGSTNVVVNIDAKGTKVQGDEPNANQLGRVVSAAVQAELIKQKRPGGLLSA